MRSVIVQKKSSLIPLYLLPQPIKILLAFIIFFVISLPGFLFLKHESDLRANHVTQKKVKLENEVTQEARNYDELVYLSKNIKTAQQQYDILMRQFPSVSKIGELLASITKLGTAQGLKFVYFKPQNSVNNIFYSSMPVDISVVGDFHQIALFLGEIANLPNSVIAINQFSLAHENNSEAVELKMTATVYTQPN